MPGRVVAPMNAKEWIDAYADSHGTTPPSTEEFNHLLDSNTYLPNGSAVAPGASPSFSCPTGEALELKGHQWKCKKD